MESSKMERNAEEQSPLLERKISTSTKIAYALGHIFNDLTAAMWFSYTLIYFQRVVLLEPIVAGGLLLLGKKKKNTKSNFLKLKKSSRSKDKIEKKIWQNLSIAKACLFFKVKSSTPSWLLSSAYWSIDTWRKRFGILSDLWWSRYRSQWSLVGLINHHT